MLLVEVGDVKDLEDEGDYGNEDVGWVGDENERVDAVEAERVVAGCRDESTQV